MTTSSDNRTPSAPRPSENHWKELTARLPESVQTLDQWMDQQLVELEESYEDYVTKASLRKSLRRS